MRDQNLPSDPQRAHLRMQGWTLAYTDQWRGRPLVMVHGLPGSARDFRWLSGALEHQARVVRVDLPGFGESVYPSVSGQRLAQRGALLVDALRALALGEVTLVGHSMGGAVVCEAAVQAPELVADVVLLASVGPRPHYWQPMYRAASRVLELPGVAQALERPLRALFVRMGFSSSLALGEMVRTVHDVACLEFERHAANVRALSEQGVPMMVAFARDDALISQDIALALARMATEGPRRIYARGGHNIQKTHAVELAEMMMLWFSDERSLPDERSRGLGVM